MYQQLLGFKNLTKLTQKTRKKLACLDLTQFSRTRFLKTRRIQIGLTPAQAEKNYC